MKKVWNSVKKSNRTMRGMCMGFSTVVVALCSSMGLVLGLAMVTA